MAKPCALKFYPSMKRNTNPPLLQNCPTERLLPEQMLIPLLDLREEHQPSRDGHAAALPHCDFALSLDRRGALTDALLLP